MQKFEAVVKVTLTVSVKVKGSFNGNYKDGRSVAEDQACDKVWDEMPSGWMKEVEPEISADCVEYEGLGEEREVERD